MFFPKLQAQRRERKTVECFSGLDRRVGSGAGCLREMKNLWSGGYPAMEVRGKRSVLTELTTPHAFLGREALVWVDGAELYINGAKTAPVLTNGDKQLVCMGAYLLVWPDKVYINTKDFSDWGRLENTRSTEGEVTFTLCDAAGTALGSYDVGTNAPSEAETGDLWLDTSRSGCVMRRYDGSAWLEMEGVCTKISATGIGVGFSAGDGVTLSGCGSSELNGLQVLETVEDNWLVVPSLCRTLDSQTAVVTVLRTVPEMDFVTEQGNRLWGCKYGIVDGEAVNEIYACKLGDFRNWNSFAGLSTDSYAAARGSDGPFTGAAACQGGVVFFKENCMERVYPAAGGGHQIVTVPCNGVRKGAGGTVAVADGVVYYLGGDGVYAFDGSIPVCVSRQFGERRYVGGVGGGESGKYWLAAKDSGGTWELLVYDTARGLWYREDEGEVVSLSRYGGAMMILRRDGTLLDTSGTYGVKETQVTWSGETGDLGLYTPEHTYLERLTLHMDLEESAAAEVYVCYDGTSWEKAGSVTGDGRPGGYVMQVRPKRCGHLRLKLEGSGALRLYHVSAVYEKGSEWG